MRIYEGPLKNPNDMPSGPVKDAYISWREQRTRCYNKNRSKYKNYGAKGIEVKYSSREFIGWWLSEIENFKGKKPTIGRIDHDGHYEFGNVVIQDLSENSSERNQRVPPPISPKVTILTNKETGEELFFKSRNSAANFLGVSAIAISGCVSKKTSLRGYRARNAA